MRKEYLRKKLIVTIITFFLFSISSISVSTASTANNIVTITVNTDAPRYYPGETVRVTGQLKEDGSGVQGGDVCISIKNPSGQEVFSICTVTGSSGGFSAVYTTTNVLGSYTVKAESHSYNVVSYDLFDVVSTDVTAETNGPYYGATNQPIQFTGSVKGGKSPYTWSWVFGDGTNTSSEKNPIYSFSSTGNFSLSLTVRDLGGYQDTSYSFVIITNELMADANGPYEAPPDTSIQFMGNAFGGYPPYTYQWDFGDGNTSNVQNPIHAFEDYGEYELTLTVFDSKNLNASTNSTVTITINLPPEKPVISGSLNGNAGEEYEYTCNTTDGNGNDVFYKWDWGDGNISEWIGPFTSGKTISFNHTWIEKGEYEIKVKAKDIYDLEGNWSDPFSITMPKSKESNHFFFDIFVFLQELFKEFQFLPFFPFL
jgi:PKD repeat protein